MKNIINTLFTDFEFLKKTIFNNEDFPVYNKEDNDYTDLVEEYVNSKTNNCYSFKAIDTDYHNTFIIFEIKINKENDNDNNYIANNLIVDYNKKTKKYQITEIEYQKNDISFIRLESSIGKKRKRVEVESVAGEDYIRINYSSMKKNGLTINVNNKSVAGFLTECDSIEKKEDLFLKLFHFKNYSIEEQELEQLKYEESINKSFFAGKIHFVKDFFKNQPKNQKKNINYPS